MNIIYLHHSTGGLIWQGIKASIVTKAECNLYRCIREDLINWIYDYQSKTEGVVYSNRGGWQSPSNFHELESFLEFKEYILSHTFQSLSYYKCI